MGEFTTLSVRGEQKERLDDLKEHKDESYVSVIDRLIDQAEGEVEQSEDVDLETVMNQLSMANEPGVEVPVEEMMSEIRKAQEIAEQARDNTEQIKQGIR